MIFYFEYVHIFGNFCLFFHLCFVSFNYIHISIAKQLNLHYFYVY